jgi:hypothetical protein
MVEDGRKVGKGKVGYILHEGIAEILVNELMNGKVDIMQIYNSNKTIKH